MAQQKIPPFSPQQLDSICRIVAASVEGKEMERILNQIGTSSEDFNLAKWKRLANALGEVQNISQTGGHIISFIQIVYDPVSWTQKKDNFISSLIELNKVLSLCGFELMETGKVKSVEKVTTLSEAEKRANRLHSILSERNIHPDILTFCKAELLVDNYFHAVLEASTSVSSKIQKMSGLDCDGIELVEQAFSFGGGKNPKIAINMLVSGTEKSEQKGFVKLVSGVFGTFRNPAAHAPKIEWVMPEEDALDILGIISLIHRKLDNAIYSITKL
jgi:uncharacterized protein (TIGR02391 family)